jgi:thioester reductase-like protein
VVVLSGDLRAPGLGLSVADRNWLAHHCRRVVHAAASVAFQPSSAGDPWATNVEGTARLLELCQSLGLSELHHLSTAFVCGDRAGPVAESDLACGQRLHNDYELSKFEAERRVRATASIQATVYRPSVIVGDSQTGATSSYHGLYRFLEAAHRLARWAAGKDRRSLPLRLPLDGDAPRNLVPVDWVARAVARIVARPAWHGGTFHLTSPAPVPMRRIKEVAEDVLRIDGVSFAGRGPLLEPSPLEEAFLARLREYAPYLHGDPLFDCQNTRAALPDCPAPEIDRAFLARLVRFAAADDWGRTKRPRHRSPHSDCAHYIEEFFPRAARQSMLASLPLDVTIGLEIGAVGRWTCRWDRGELIEVRRGTLGSADVGFRMEPATFDAVVRGGLSPHDAFLSRDIEIVGDVEKGLKLAVLFGRFVQEVPYEPDPHWELCHADPCAV